MVDHLRRRAIVAAVGSLLIVAGATYEIKADPVGIVFHGATSGGNAGGAALTLDRPVEASIGDLLIASIDAAGAPTITKPAGWMVARSTSSGTAMKQVTYYHVTTASEPSNYTWTLSKGKAAAGGILAYAGVDAATPIEASSGAANASSTTITAPSISVAESGAMLVAAFGVRTGTTIAPPGGMVERVDVSSTATSTRVTSEVADSLQASPGATGDKTAVAGTANIGIGQLFALRAATPPPTSVPPTAVNSAVRTFEATPVLATLKATDPEQCQLTFQIVDPPANGSLGAVDPRACKMSKTGGPNTDTATVTYTPNPAFLGPDPFTFTANDGVGDSNTATIVVTVKALPPGVVPVVETTPPVGAMDIADDPAIWVHPTDPGLSLVIGTSKSPTDGGLYVYDLDGSQLQRIASGANNNVDLRYGFSLDGETVDIVAVANKASNAIDFYAIDPVARRLTAVGSKATTSLAEVGLCMYRSSFSGNYYVFTVRSSGVVRQYEIGDQAGSIVATSVRSFDAGGLSEGCAVDDELGNLFISEEQRALWKYGAEPGDGGTRAEVDSVGASGHLVGDVEGVGIYLASGGTGYVIVSNQGESTYTVYRREGANDFLGTFRIVDGNGVDGAQETDGLDVVNAALGAAFPSGLLVAHDHRNVGGAASNFKYVRWGDVADALGLVVDTAHDPRVGT